MKRNRGGMRRKAEASQVVDLSLRPLQVGNFQGEALHKRYIPGIDGIEP